MCKQIPSRHLGIELDESHIKDAGDDLDTFKEKAEQDIKKLHHYFTMPVRHDEG